jgi:hypothetical protein
MVILIYFVSAVLSGYARAAQAARIELAFYEHQKPRERVAGLMGLHLPGVGLPVVPQSRQIQ